MSIETLTKLVELVKSLSGDTKDLFILYFSINIAEYLIGAVIGIVGIVLAARTIKAIIVACSGGQAEFLCECRDLLRIGCPGPLTNAEGAAVKSRIRELIAQSKAKP